MTIPPALALCLLYDCATTRSQLAHSFTIRAGSLMDEADFLLSFRCLPPSNQNEWLNLKGFVDSYNSTHHTNYILKSFPENDNRTSPEPEVLLCDGDAKMVIERKVFAFPPSHIREHQLWHQFNNIFLEKVVDTFSDSLYILEIKDVDMPASKKEIIKLADEIASAVIEHEYEIKNAQGIYSDDLVPWSFFELSEMDREDSPIDFGVGIRLKTSSYFYDSHQLGNAMPIIKG
ncbi:hypothetical protein JOY44_06700 [Phormidium sp. CLA17]|uniref:hypothetical protein n=1 Tax=Leptolyngbya sp. Cla-17 TaxID=2803751 RepID=UPI00184BE7E1|nr:hypothetical protein [Leptolyngbya sp. Cla-17]MBM0741310.1 hypothetical protein [Leptolyngbya sp. Cla-17]